MADIPAYLLPILIKKEDAVEVKKERSNPKAVLFLLPAFLTIVGEFLRDGKIVVAIAAAVIFAILILSGSGGPAWSISRLWTGRCTPDGPRGWPILGSWKLMQGRNVHRELAEVAWSGGASTRKLMAISVGTTRIALTSDPDVAKEILRSVVFGDRPVKLAALLQGFDRAIGFAPQGVYWRHLRKIAVVNMFSHQQIVNNFVPLQRETDRMISAITLGTISSRTPFTLRLQLQMRIVMIIYVTDY